MRFAVIIAFLLLAGCIDRSTAARPQLLNSSLVYNGPGNVLGTKWDTAQVVLQFDQELYTSHMIILPNQEKDCPPPPDCQPCDLTASGASPCNTNCCGLSAASPAELSEWCDPSQPFTALNLNEPSPLLTMQRGEERFFRFYLPPETWCSPIRVQVSLASGQVWLFLSDSSPYPNITNSVLFRTTTYGRNFGYVTMGPWFDGSVGLGTVALALTAPFRSVFSIEVIVPQAKMPFKPATPPPADACQNIPSEYVPQGTDTPLICLTDSVTNFQSGWPSGTELQTIFSLEPGCHTFSFTVYGLNFSTTGVDVDLFCMPMVSDSVNLFENTVLGSWTYKEDEVTMSTCSDERVWVRCDAEIWSLGPFAMLFSTAGPVIRRPITALSPYDYTTWAGKDSMVLVAPGSRVLTSTACIDWTSGCSLYFPSYPTFDSLRFWPPPTVITSSNIYEDLLPPIFPLPFLTTALPGRYVLTIVLSSPSSTRFTSLQSLLDIEGLVLVATNLVNAEGEAVQLPNDLTQRSAQDMITPYFPHMKLTSVPRNHPPCTWPAFSAIGAVGVSLNSQLTNQSAVVLPPRYQLDLLASSDTFVWCRSAALDLLVNDTSSSLVLDSSCQYMPGTADFMDDPCCNPVLLSIYCCAPRPSLQAVTTYSDPSAAELKTCTHPECSQSLLSTLAQNLNQVTAGIACTAAPSAREQSRELTKMLTPLATCRQESGIGVNFDGVPCQQDADCARFNASCGVFSRICELTDLDLVEALYIDCFIDNVTDTYLLNWLKLNVLPASVRDLDKNDPLMKAAIMDAATQSDCLGPWPLDISRRSRSIEAVQSSLCATNILTRYITDPTPADYERECGQFECLGTSCQQPPRTCFNYCTRVTTEYTSSQELCDQPSTCRFDDCDNANVCAYCPLDTSKPCIVNTSITSPQQCQQTRVCELDDGSFVWGLSEAECQALTFCTVDCLGSSCRSGWLLAGVCQATGATSAVACNNIAAGDPLWYQNTTCLLPGLTTRTDCLQADANYQWDTCQQQSVCSSSASPVASYLACFQDQYRDCQSQQECESAGACSDIEWTKIADNGTVRYGACFTPGARTGSLLTSGSSGTLCLNDQVRTTNGCRISRASVPNAAACQPDLGNGVAAAAWLTPITDQATCENVTGCNIFEYEDVRFSWRDAAECEACGGVPTREWHWTPGVWRHSASRTPSWQPRSLFVYNYEPALSFQTTESWIVDAITQQFDLLLRSEVVCQNNLVRIPLFPVVCDCYSDTENCFDILSPFTLISLAYPCALTRSETLFGLNSITFYENSVPAGCVLTYIFAISRRSFDAPPLPPQVSFRLAAKQTRTDSAVQNTKGITVGEVSGDGVRIVKRGPLNIFELCLQVVKSPTGAYPVRDFGTTTQELSVVRPLDVQGGEERQLLNQTFFCANLTAEQWEDVYRNSTLYIIPIIRETNWQSSSKSSSYSTTDRALIYTLAAEYLLCIIFLTMFCGVAFWFWYTTKQGRMLLFFAGLFWLFLCIFRVVYLFAYPDDAISDPLANYAVWELPSFFYFTAFSIILATWFEGTVPKPLQKRARYGIIIVINAFCICLFVSVMIAFAILNSEADTNPSACPGRVEGTPTSKSSDIRTLSLVYQSVMIAISFLMALAFVYSLLQVSLSSRNLGLSWERTYSRAKNLFHIAVFTVVGFLTRCILFIILLSIDLTSTIYLFITLTITEVFVICAVCSQFQILRIAGHRLRSTSASPSGARSSHVRDTSLTSFSSSPSPDTHS